MSVSRRKLPKGPRSAILQSLRVLRDPFRFYEEMRRDYGTLFTLPTLNGLLVISGRAEGARELFRARSESFVAGFGVEAVAPVVGSGSLLLLAGERHRRERKLLSPFFHGSRVRTYGTLVRDTALRHADRWKEGPAFPIHASLQGIALEVILRAIFGVQSTREAERFGEAVTHAIDAAHPVPFFFKALQRELGGYGPWARFVREKRRLDAVLQAHLATRRRALARGDAGGDDVLSQMLSARFEDGSAMSDDDICSQLLTLLVAGHETTATTLAWIFYELHRHPEMLARLRAEIGELGPDPAPEAFGKLSFLRAVVDETLRIHPIISEVFRTVKDRFPFQGYEIPAGVTVSASIVMIHNDPELYPDPTRFRPDRFLERRYGPDEHLPFGGGHRRCLGDAFAMNEIAVVLATLLPRYELALASERPLRMVRRNLTLAPEAGVPMVLRGRRAV